MPDWGGPRRLASDASRNAPFKWNHRAIGTSARPRVFAFSLADFFDKKVPRQWRDDAWEVIRDCPELDWLILTKRPQNAIKMKMLPEDWGDGWPHVWLGATVENKKERRRIDRLLRIPAVVHWISAEPMLESLPLDHWLAPPNSVGINWVVCGGETGGHERVSEPDWFRDVLAQCREKHCAFFMKQMTKKARIPDDLMVREFPVTNSDVRSWQRSPHMISGGARQNP